MFVRSLLFGAALLGVASAQTSTPTEIRENRIQSALAALRDGGSAYLVLEGTETTGNTTVTLKTLAYFATDTTVTPNIQRAEIRQYRNDKMTTRVVADGRTLWAYHNTNFTYSADLYGRFAQNANPNYAQDFVNLLSASVGQEAAFVVRALREAFAGDAALYHSWMPIVEPVDGTPDVNDVLYTYGNPVTKSINFDLDADDQGNYSLAGIDYSSVSRLAGKDRTTSFRIRVDSIANVPAEMDFQPYAAASLAGWKPVVRARPGIQ